MGGLRLAWRACLSLAIGGEIVRESHFQNFVVRYAKDHGWLVHHTRTALSKSGRYMTPVQGHIGFPDLVLVSPEHRQLLFVELKQDRGALREPQRIWLSALSAIAGVYVCLWRPKMLEEIKRFLESPHGFQAPGLWAT